MLSTHHLGVYLNDFLLKYESIEYDEFGMPIINGKPGCTFRMVTNPRK